MYNCSLKRIFDGLYLKGTVSRDLRPVYIFMKHLPLAPDSHRNVFSHMTLNPSIYSSSNSLGDVIINS